MCGIVGTLVFNGGGFRVTEPYIARMRDAMAHRGPDGAGSWISSAGGAGLGHRRLSIIDLSDAAAQPMTNEDGSLWVVFNGEIYNHTDIRRELEGIGGHRWKTDHSDTEVILHAFEQWGIDCLARFRGMFAFALWDVKKRQLWLVRDRIGVKPLYYSIHDGRITFASEIKALLQDPDQKRDIDAEAVYHYLSFRVTPPPQTMFAGIRKLANGTWLRVSENGDVEQRRYWDAWQDVQPLTSATEDEIVERLLHTLRAAVRLRKISDVPVGVFLSGGIDSSTNTALFSEDESSVVKTFAIGYDQEYKSYVNELHYARAMAQFAKTEHYERVLTQGDAISFLRTMVHLQDEPLADPVCVPVYYVSKLARDNGVVVCHVGEGSDELFFGYPAWKQRLDLQRWNDLPVPVGLKRMGLSALGAFGRSHDVRYELLRRGASGLPVFWGGSEVFTEAEKQSLMPRARFHHFSSWEVIRPIRAFFEQNAWEPSHLNWMSYLDLNIRLPELLLMRVDKMSMAVSLEARVPFLDHEFVQLALSIPTEIKLKHGELKYILKKAVRGLIPAALIDRKKQGFGVPIAEWSRSELGSYAQAQIGAFCRESDLLDAQQVQRSLASGNAAKFWLLLNLTMWWKLNIARSTDIQDLTAFPMSAAPTTTLRNIGSSPAA